MNTTVNLYGDRRILAGDGAHGIDVAAQRADALDEAAIARIREIVHEGCQPSAVDLGCGSGGQVARMCAAGARVLGVDISDQAATVLSAGPTATFLRMDLSMLEASEEPLPGAPFDVVVSQRTIHYLPHPVALHMITAIGQRHMRQNGRLYLSASGMLSELADGYQHRASAIGDRFHPLSPAMVEKHGICGPVCLYTPQELADLVSAAGFEVLDVSASAFGNAKVMARWQQ